MGFVEKGIDVAAFVFHGVCEGFLGKGGENVYDKGQSFVARTLRGTSDGIITPVEVAPVDITGRVRISGELDNKPVKVDVVSLAAAVALDVFAGMAALNIGEYILGGGGDGAAEAVNEEL